MVPDARIVPPPPRNLYKQPAAAAERLTRQEGEGQDAPIVSYVSDRCGDAAVALRAQAMMAHAEEEDMTCYGQKA